MKLWQVFLPNPISLFATACGYKCIAKTSTQDTSPYQIHSLKIQAFALILNKFVKLGVKKA